LVDAAISVPYTQDPNRRANLAQRFGFRHSGLYEKPVAGFVGHAL